MRWPGTALVRTLLKPFDLLYQSGAGPPHSKEAFDLNDAVNQIVAPFEPTQVIQKVIYLAFFLIRVSATAVWRDVAVGRCPERMIQR